MTTRPNPMYAGYRFPAEVISYAVYLYGTVNSLAPTWWLAPFGHG
jgi:hypothetical protein